MGKTVVHGSNPLLDGPVVSFGFWDMIKRIGAIHNNIQLVLHFIHHEMTLTVTVDGLNQKACAIAVAQNHIQCFEVRGLGFGIDGNQTSESNRAIDRG